MKLLISTQIAGMNMQKQRDFWAKRTEKMVARKQ